MTEERRERWPHPATPGTPPERQDRTIHPVPDLTLVGTIFRDLTDPRDRVYNR